MDDFLYILKIMLTNRLPEDEVQEQIELYENYIEEQIAGGKTTEEVMMKLGDPQAVADMIVEDYEKRKKAASPEPKKMKDMTVQDINAQIQNPERGFHAEFKENEGWDVRLGKFKLNTWYGTLIILAIVLLIFIGFSQLKTLF